MSTEIGNVGYNTRFQSQRSQALKRPLEEQEFNAQKSTSVAQSLLEKLEVSSEQSKSKKILKKSVAFDAAVEISQVSFAQFNNLSQSVKPSYQSFAPPLYQTFGCLTELEDYDEDRDLIVRDFCEEPLVLIKDSFDFEVLDEGIYSYSAPEMEAIRTFILGNLQLEDLSSESFLFLEKTLSALVNYVHTERHGNLYGGVICDWTEFLKEMKDRTEKFPALNKSIQKLFKEESGQSLLSALLKKAHTYLSISSVGKKLERERFDTPSIRAQFGCLLENREKEEGFSEIVTYAPILHIQIRPYFKLFDETYPQLKIDDQSIFDHFESDRAAILEFFVKDYLEMTTKSDALNPRDKQNMLNGGLNDILHALINYMQTEHHAALYRGEGLAWDKFLCAIDYHVESPHMEDVVSHLFKTKPGQLLLDDLLRKINRYLLTAQAEKKSGSPFLDGVFVDFGKGLNLHTSCMFHFRKSSRKSPTHSQHIRYNKPSKNSDDSKGNG